MAELRVKSTGTLKLFESDNTSSVTIASPASLGADRTITLPDGDVTLVAGTMSTGGVALTGSTDNTVTTVTGADAIQGETNFIYNGTIVGCGADGANADLGTGLHVKTADSTASALSGADQLVLESAADCGLSILSDTNDYGQVVFGDSGDNDIGKIRYNHSNNSMDFYVNAAERMRIDSAGLVGIGTSSPTARIHAVRDSTTAWAGHIENSASSNYGRVLKLVLDNDFDDNASVFMIAYGAAAEKFKVFSDGDVQNADNSYGGISDEKLKQDITDASSQWDDIKNIKVRKFKFKKDVLDKGDSEEHWRIGLVAQEAELVSPKLIKDNPDMDSVTNEFTGTTTKGIKYSVLYMKAIKALQESMERIEQLEAKVTALENA